MSINKTPPYDEYIATGVSEYFISFEFKNEKDITVIVTNPETYEMTILINGVDYTVVQGEYSGGYITLTSDGLEKTPNGFPLTIIRKPEFSQNTTLEEGDAFYAKTIEASLDELASQTQYLKILSARALMRPHGINKNLTWKEFTSAVDNAQNAEKAAINAKNAAQELADRYTMATDQDIDNAIPGKIVDAAQLKNVRDIAAGDGIPIKGERGVKVDLIDGENRADNDWYKTYKVCKSRLLLRRSTSRWSMGLFFCLAFCWSGCRRHQNIKWSSP